MITAVATRSFIETQFPISKLSKESYKERKAGSGQTLTGLGKWWGRKPLILVRAVILGLLFPASDDPKKDREIWLLSRDSQSSEQFAGLNRRYDEMQAEFACVSLATSETSQEEAL